MAGTPASGRSRVRRMPERGHYDRATVHAILDEAMVCHVAFVDEGAPVVIPALHARDGDTLLLHGASSSRMLRHMAGGNPLSIAVTLLDGLVIAKTVFNQSMNYRSVVVFGTGRLIDDAAEKLRALELLTDRLIPGHWATVRPPDAQELKATSIVAVGLDEVSAKIRSGPPGDDGEDREWPGWAGVIPMSLVFGSPMAASYTTPGVPLPPHLAGYRRGPA